MPRPTQSDPQATGGYVQVTQISTDGFAAYPKPLTWLSALRQVRPDHQGLSQRRPARPLRPAGNGRHRAEGHIRDNGRTKNARYARRHVERHNLTIRTLMKRFTRLSLGFSKKLANLEAAVAMFLAYYNFCGGLGMPMKGRYPSPGGHGCGRH